MEEVITGFTNNTMRVFPILVVVVLTIGVIAYIIAKVKEEKQK